MKRAILALLFVAARARAEDEAPPTPKPVPAGAVAVAQLSPLAGASQYRAPNALPPVSAQLFHVGGLFEVQPMFVVSVGDPFWRTVGMGIRIERHFDERWSIAAHTLGGISLLSAPVEVCGDTACSAPAEEKLRGTPGKLQFLAGAELSWAPIYGKLSLFGERTLHFDAYLSAGPELVREMIAQDAASPVTGRWAAGGRVSIGERLFVTDRFMVRAGVAELIYDGRVRGQGEIERKLSFEAGVAWLFGGQ
jgi:outer membrane beta-barrel protein